MAEGGHDYYVYEEGRSSQPRRGRGSHRGRRGRSRSRERSDLPEDLAARNAQRMGQGNYSAQPHLRAPLLPVEDVRPRGGRGRGRGGYDRGHRGGGGQHRGAFGGHRTSTEGITPRDIGWSYEDFYAFAQKTPDDLVMHLFENQAKLKFFLKRLTKMPPKLFGSIVHVLDKIVRSEEKEWSGILMAVFFDPNESGSLWVHATMAIKKMPQEASQDLRDKNKDILKKLCQIFQAALERIPQTSAYTLPIGDLKFALMLLSREAPRQYSNLLQQVSELEQFRMDAMVAISQPLQEHKVPDVARKQEEPLPYGNFRDVPVLPRVNELEYKHGKVNQEVRANKKSGRYINWDHYLDIHFRLLREDFIFPLREGVQLYVSENRQRNTNVRVYTGVHILEPVCLMAGIGFQLKFDVSRLRRVNWDHSKRLIFGALLCLSTDKFQSIHFATVVNRESKQLEKGIVTVKFEDGTDGFRIDPSKEFVMLESSAYFEAYCHVLKKLKEINTDLMPFTKYLVECDSSAIQLPLYLQTTRNVSFDLHDSLGIHSRSPTGRAVDITRPESWPATEVTCFDPTQMKAMQMALSQDLSIIQGPPGTGKTYVGTRIVEALLQNKMKWSRDVSNPILVVCYTNHALDQFLEFIQDLVIGGTSPHIIRIGGRARSEKMKACSLQAARKEAKELRSIPRAIYKPVAEMTARMFARKAELENVTFHAPSQEDKLLPYQSILPYIKREHRQQLESMWMQYESRDQGREVEIWLDLWFPTPLEPPSQEEIAMQLEEQLAIQERPDTQNSASVEQITHQGLQAVDLSHQLEQDEVETVQVDEEARLAQDERLMEGEEVLLPEMRGKGHAKEEVERTFPEQEVQSHITVNEFGWKVEQLKPAEKKKRIADGMKQHAMSSRDAQRIKDIWKLHRKDKWRLYQHWAQEFIRNSKTTAQMFATGYEEICRERERLQRELDFHLLQNADIVGMTTTGAAKYNYILQRLSPKIVVIEEAAEVLESHIVSCLSSGVQQLVLIGDHKQLRPKPNTYELVKDYNMAISLFERLAHNGFPLVTLGIQHRMRPEISCLVRPHIYEELEDHATVKDYPSISGVGENLFFLNHNVPEDTKDDDDLLSYSNQFEADFIVALCRYLLKQGQYTHDQITVLTMYKGQLLKLKKKMPIAEFMGVRVAAVDDFQGEENNIILLSLVRSNENGNVGFLREANRVCVALSRAKWALYVIGNFEMLRQIDGTPLPGIIEYVEKRGSLGNAMPLFCSNHPGTKTLVKSAADFTNVPEGGCTKPCGTRLRCGHACPRTCHVADKEHAKIPCMRSCEKLLPCSHKCTRRCYECSKGCRPCSEPVSKRLPCGHQDVLPCYKSPLDHKCVKPCSKMLPCRHPCQKRCSEPCTVKCPVRVRRTLGCGHDQEVPCSIAPSDHKCLKPCEALLECGHPCPGTCSGCAGGRLHQPCSHPCDRSLACGHVCKFPCTNACPPCEHSCRNYCNHSKCPRKCKEPCASCMEQCQWQCEHHRCHRKCGEMCDRPRCDQPCKKKLKCGHPCIGLCGEECPRLCRICNKDKVCEIFFGTEDDDDAHFIQLKDCKHVLEVSGLDQWMDMNGSDISKAAAIQFKTCPKCKTPIRRSLRYGNIIKKSLEDMEMVKKAVMRGQTNAVDVNHVLIQLRQLRLKLHGNLHYHVIRQHLVDTKDRTKAVIDVHRLHTTAHHVKAGLQTKMQVLKALGDLLTRLGSQPTTATFMIRSTPLKCNEMLEEMQPVLQFTMRHEYFSAQQLSDIETELKRLSLLTSWCEISHKMQTGESYRVTPGEVTQLVQLLTYLRCAGIGAKADKLTEKYHDGIKKLFDSLKNRCGVLGISRDEREMIVKAMGLRQGHWFKCPNGHFYCITECGGATMESTCPDCKATIGGSGHRLRDDNQLAPEMDGARHAAFSDAANLFNFDPAQFR